MQAPESLRFIRGYVQRANETQNSHPLIAYFCRMQAISKIISQGAHTRDEEAGKFAEELMTALEKVRKSDDLSENDREIIEDEQKSQDYVLKFGQGVLARAQQQIAQHKVTGNTAMTLLAAATFLDVATLWPGNDPAENIKFAKYHAARILKAVKEGQDPNKLYEEEGEEVDDELEKELDSLVKASSGGEAGDKPAVETADEAEKAASEEAATPESDISESTPSLPSAPINEPNPLSSTAKDEQEEGDDSLPSVPGELPGHKLPPTPNKQPNNLGLPEAPEEQPSVVFDYEKAPSAPKLEEFKQANNSKPVPQVTAKPQENANVQQILSQAQTTKSAQKHAKFAISALNYDDYPTAIKELESALKVLRGD